MAVGDLLSRAREDARRIISGPFSTPITFKGNGVNPVEDQIINGTATEHAFLFDDQERLVVSNNASITVNELDLNDAGIVTRINNEVSLPNTIIEYQDNTGNVGRFAIKHVLPNKTLGHIVCMLAAVV